MSSQLQPIVERRRLKSLAITPRALIWRAGNLRMGSRDRRRIYAIDPMPWVVLDANDSPGIPWAAVAFDGGILRLDTDATILSSIDIGAKNARVAI